MSRKEPTFTPWSRAIFMARSATRDVMPKLTTTTSAPSRSFSSQRMILSALSRILSWSRACIFSWVGTFMAG